MCMHRLVENEAHTMTRIEARKILLKMDKSEQLLHDLFPKGQSLGKEIKVEDARARTWKMYISTGASTGQPSIAYLVVIWIT